MSQDTPKKVWQTYEYDHFAGSQVSIYIGDILIDEINRVEFVVQQTKKPIYGYASQYFDAVASGQVLVSGTFTINFKEAGYMHLVLKRYLETIGSEGDSNPEKTGAKNIPFDNAQILRRNIERLLADDAKKSTIRTPDMASTQDGNLNPTEQIDKFSFYNDLAALPDEEFENIAEVLEDSLWQDKQKNSENLGNITKPTDFNLDSNLRRADQFPGFTIWITYGDIGNPLANHTIRKLTGVHIVGSGQTIEISGEPVFEQYDFFARNLL